MLSADAQLTYWRAYILAGVCDAAGYLIKDGQSFGIESLHNPAIRKPQRAIDELCHRRDMDGLPWMRLTSDGTMELPGWIKDQETKDAARKHRSRHTDSHADSHALFELKPTDCHDQEYIDTPRVDKLPSGPADAKNGVAPWFIPIREDVVRVADILGRMLTLEQRIPLGRYAAYRWAGYSRDEGKNLRKGTDFAAQLSDIFSKHRFANTTVREFIGAMDRVFTAGNRARIHSLWTVTAAFEETV